MLPRGMATDRRREYFHSRNKSADNGAIEQVKWRVALQPRSEIKRKLAASQHSSSSTICLENANAVDNGTAGYCSPKQWRRTLNIDTCDKLCEMFANRV